jgi:hypothetical protein
MIRPGWRRDDFPEPSVWTVDYDDDHRRLAGALLERLDGGPGVAVVRGVPTAHLTVGQAQSLAPDMLCHLGEPLLQGPLHAGTYGWLVRDEGASRFTDGRRFSEGVYTSKSRDHLDIHNDSAMHAYGSDFDYFALLVHRAARSGGESVLVNARTVYATLAQEFPRAWERLRRPFAFERRHVIRSGQAPVSWGPVFSEVGGRLRVRCNRQRIEMAPALTGRPLTADDVEALDALDSVLARPELRVTHLLREGECLVVDDHEVLHGRNAFDDHADPGLRRCLVRVLLRRA